ncbi:DUF1592 domain-containing protein [Verrucomicrobiales bacterium BCK34]|nr:DUF1592 domain-containing protein [Verrucomicrobiales bacterium BCK34]
MKFHWLAIAILAPSFQLPAEDKAKVATDFLATYCLECHDDLTQEGERNFYDLEFPITDEKGLIAVQEIIDALNLGEMPPKKAEQPDEAERAAAVAALSGQVADVYASLKSTGGQTVLRRLNEREYLNTLEDLFARRVDTFAPTSTFPTDQTAEHIDTLGDVLVTSGFLLDNYFHAADRVVEKALGQIGRPKVMEWTFKDSFRPGAEMSYSHKKVFNNRFLCLYEVMNSANHEGGYGGINEFKEGVHADGIYEVKVLAQAMHRDSHYDKEILKMDLSEPYRLGIVTGTGSIGELHHPQPIEPQLDEVTLKDGEPQWYTMKIWLEKGQQPRFTFPNGMANCRTAFSRIAREYNDDWPDDDKHGGSIVEARRIVLQHGKMPHIRISEVKLSGPHYETWPPEPQKIVFGEGGFKQANTGRILSDFARRAFRRPVEPGEMKQFTDLVDARIAAGHSPRQATLDAIKGILCSPSFLYLGEAGAEKGGALSSHDLASRLSYFLTGTMPDPELMKLAESGAILQKDILLKQVDRLLDEKRSDAFLDGFLDSWLNLRALGDQPPDRQVSGEYFYDDLETAMQEEVKYFTRDLIEHNGSITNYLRSDYAWINYPLAELYGIEEQFPNDDRYTFQKVGLTQSNRGGLLGMAAIHTVSANGLETSPVVRGIYILENLLGSPPPKPPDEVPELEPDTRGATSIRDQLLKHREMKTCAACHVSIDPPGFALENFDPIGRWRSKYPDKNGKPGKGPRIDASGEATDGTPFSGVAEFKGYLMKRKDVFAQHLAERLLTYGMGRRVEALDRPAVEHILKVTKANQYGLRTMIREVVVSDCFLSR